MKKSKAILSAYQNHPFYRNRTESDSFFALTPGSISLKGNLDYAVRFIEDYQLMNPSLWAEFVQQFRNTPVKADDADDGWRGEYWGKMMRGACFTYQYTRNQKLYEILCETVRDMMSTADENGRISSYSVTHQYRGWDIWSRKYVLLGMQYFIEICRDKDFIKQITDCMCAQVDYLISTIGLESEGKILITKASSHWHGMNSSSLLEPIVRLYNLTGEIKYLHFATYIVDCGVIYDEGVSIFELAYENKIDPYQYPVVKAYEMMSCFEGLLEYYRVTNIEKWKQAVINFANRVRLSDISIIGSAGCTHELFDHTLVRQTNTLYNGVLQETCVTVTWIKFCYQLLCLTGNSVYADEIEKSVYNALLGAVNFNKNEKNGGLPFDSYSPLLFNTRMRGIGGQKYMASGAFYGCCACIGSAGTGMIPMQSVMLSEDGVVFNTFAPGSVKTVAPDGTPLTFETETAYPVDGTVDITVKCPDKTRFSVFVRIPEWSKNTLMSVNGIQKEVTPGSYAVIDRVWQNDDYITVKFDMRCRLISAVPDPKDPCSGYHVALKKGPLVLARDRRLGEDIEHIVNFTPDADGCVACTKTEAKYVKSLCAFLMTDSTGYEFTVIDYASAGSTWEEDSMTTAWLPTKNYWKTDFDRPVYIISPNSWDSSDSKFSLYIDKEGILSVTKEKGDEFMLESQPDGNYKIKVVSSGLYLDLTDDENFIVSSEEGKTWKIAKYAQNRYRIYDKNGRSLVGSNDTLKSPHIKFEKPSFKTLQIFRIEQA